MAGTIYKRVATPAQDGRVTCRDLHVRILTVLTCISQLERFQLISSGADEGAVPDVAQSRIVHLDDGPKPRSSISSQRPASIRMRGRAPSHHTSWAADVAEESRSREMVIAVDRIFANTSKLNGSAIVSFVKALSEVSWQEIQSSGQSEHPRMFSLQKVVEVSYYNMDRIRVEWSSIWAILGDHFNQVFDLGLFIVFGWMLTILRSDVMPIPT